MFVVSGVSGNTGAAVAKALLARGLAVRVVVRRQAAAEAWIRRGASAVQADFNDPATLTRALYGADAAYVLNPPAYASADLFAAAQAVIDGWKQSIPRSGLRRLVALSSIGSHLASGTGILRANWMFEQQLRNLPLPVTFVRPAYFMSNWAGVAHVAASEGRLECYLSPLDRAIPMVAAADIGEVCANAMLESFTGVRAMELQGPRTYSPVDVAAAFSEALRKPVEAVALPPASWASRLTQAGFTPRSIVEWTEFFQAFNAGHIDFEGASTPRLSGPTGLAEVVNAISGDYERASAEG